MGILIHPHCPYLVLFSILLCLAVTSLRTLFVLCLEIDKGHV